MPNYIVYVFSSFIICCAYVVASDVQVNSRSVSREKPSAVKKLLKPHKNVLQLTVERNSKSRAETNDDTGQVFMQEWSEGSYGSCKRGVTLSSSSTPTYKRRNHVVPETLTQVSPSMF